jgi:ectoine hydroxylase-related dioxygenase (phytanoyl-CoA dioxygenase family)
VLSESQIDAYQRQGYVIVPAAFTADEVDQVRNEVERLFTLEHPGRVLEKDGVTVRGIHGCHQISTLFARLVRLPRMLTPAQQVLGGDVYVHQSKVNAKRALQGDIWRWHQDFTFWHNEDGMPEPHATTVALFLDEADYFNGPLLFVPGSTFCLAIVSARSFSARAADSAEASRRTYWQRLAARGGLSQTACVLVSRWFRPRGHRWTTIFLLPW